MELIEYIKSLGNVGVALSGGVDSSYLAYAVKQSGIPCKAYTVKSQFVPQFELDDAKKIAECIGIPLEIIDIDVLEHDDVTSNPSDRCYYCKHHVFTTISEQAKRDGFSILCDGTNASVATRFQAGQHITGHDLEHIEKAEGYLFSLGLSDFRVRLIGNTAKIQVPENQIAIVIKNRIEILICFKSMFDDVVLDLEVRS